MSVKSVTLTVVVPDELDEAFDSYSALGAPEWVAHVKNRLPQIREDMAREAAARVYAAFAELTPEEQRDVLAVAADRVKAREGEALAL